MPVKKGSYRIINPIKAAIEEEVKRFWSCPNVLDGRDQFKTDELIVAMGKPINGSNRILIAKTLAAMGFIKVLRKGSVADGGGFFFQKPAGAVNAL